MADEGTCAVDGVAVAQRLFLGHELQPPGVGAGHLGIGALVAGAHDKADGVDAGGDHFVEEDIED